MLFRSIYFDCDSTLSAIEGVDELLRSGNQALRQQVQQLTDAAMNGTLPLAAVYEQRLNLLAPTSAQLQAVGAMYCAQALPDAQQVIAALRHLGKQVGVLSGGLEPAVRPFAQWLGIEAAQVHAVPVQFDAAGAYVDFDRRCPLWRNHGKAELLARLQPLPRPLACIGDGITDLETQTVADRFIGFGGVVARAAVQQGAQFFVSQPRLAALLPHLLTAAEQQALAAHPAFAVLLHDC